MLRSTKSDFDLRGLTLVVVAGAWLVGILLDAWIPLPAFALLAGASTALFLLIPLWHDRRARLIMIVLLWLLLGAWRYTVVSPSEDAQAISKISDTSKIEVRGTVADEPEVVGKSLILIINVSSVSTDQGATWQNADGKLEVLTLDGQSAVAYGPHFSDSVELQGRLQRPRQNSSPGIFASMAFPRISISSTGSNPIIAALYALRMTLATVLAQSLPQPEAALLIAILLGLRTPALKPLLSAFNTTGTAHLLAPSGFKVTILAGLVAAGTRWLYKPSEFQNRLLPAQKRSRQRRHWLATTIVIGNIASYTLLNGAGPAALRAGMMGIIIVIAPRFGRVYNVYTALAMATLLITAFDPFVLWEAGFQLSFVGTAGIVLLTPFFQRLLQPVEHLPLGAGIAEIMAVTLAAQVATLPLSALDFQQISFIAPLTNILTVPLLSTLIVLGFLICGSGLLFAPLGFLCGWVAWPLLWYVLTLVTWCSHLAGASLPINNLSSGLAWGYYGLLGLLISFLLYRWPTKLSPQHVHAAEPLLSPRTRLLLQLSAALLIILATGTSVLATRPDGELTIAFLNVGPLNQPSQGEAIFIHTPDGKSILIDGGLDATSLAQELDSRLPPWQRLLDMVILTTPRADALSGLQDIINRYQIGEIVDAGMLHPNSSYGLWRRTISERNLNYGQVQQGMIIALGKQVALQVLWPPTPLHKSSSEEVDNGLIMRLVGPGIRALLVGASALSQYALMGLLTNVDASYLQADIVQVDSEVGKKMPTEFSTLLQRAKPSLVLVTPAALSAKQRKARASSVLYPLPSVFGGTDWQVMQTAQTGTIVISSSNQGWSSNV